MTTGKRLFISGTLIVSWLAGLGVGKEINDNGLVSIPVGENRIGLAINKGPERNGFDRQYFLFKESPCVRPFPSGTAVLIDYQTIAYPDEFIPRSGRFYVDWGCSPERD